MQKTTTLKDFNVFLLKACLMTLILGFFFSVSFAQNQSVSPTKPASAEKRKQAAAANNATASATFSDAVKNESAVKTNPSSVNAPAPTAANAATTGVDARKAQMKAAGKNTPTDLKPAPTQKSAAEIERKKTGQSQNEAAKADRFLKAKGN